MPSIQNSKSTLNFLDTIGTMDRGDAMPTNNIAKALVELAGFLIETATANLEKGGHVASGKTISSMKVANVNLNGPRVSAEIHIADNYKFIDQGVKGVESGSGRYSFKTKKPSKKMVSAILRWSKRRSLSGKIKYTAVSKNERRNKKIHKMVSGAKSRESLAYAIATNIKKKGIKRTLFFTNAVKATEKQQKKIFGDALRLDIINALKDL